MSTKANTGKRMEVLANPFTRETRELMTPYLDACRRVLESGWYILGKEVEAFEKEFAGYLGGGESVGCGNGMDALMLSLKALGIGPGDEVITTPLSAVATALAITHVGAKPVFADVDPKTLSLDPEKVENAVTSRTRAVIPVHLYGFPADVRALAEICARKKLKLVEDCAQAVGARAAGRTAGQWGDTGCFSFYPTKNLGAFGDGGAVLTRDPELAAKIRKLRNYGQKGRYEHEFAGYNSRLDELHAALLRIKLTHLGVWTTRRRQIAALYDKALQNSSFWHLPKCPVDSEAVYHLYPIQTENRDSTVARLKDRGVEALVHYPTLLPEQDCYRELVEVSPAKALPNAYQASRKLVSLPISPYLTDEECNHVVEALV